ncbi:putative carbohydrate-binding module family 13 protein [Lyophyllum shimeji]|uniref:Carbohydrate-binding module family 13 protein n=1 Tax=Lyophyllum shimeji TaxID=47721 RepID=A0A9P3PWD5_LYOSH|nr:putative carbohydrate-binding module family 13 protein [Lyophyllum shimeji]
MHSFAATALLLTSSALGVLADASFYPGVIATGTQGPTNPPKPTLGTPVNQTSMARLLSINSIDDFCLFAPPEKKNISESETEEVAWCTKQRNNARLIPDGTLTGVSFLKTSAYVQVLGYGDFTKLNIPYGDYGGELDPHGAYGSGNPIGGNVTSNITGSDQNFAEWMLYIDYNQFCLRVCTSANSTYSAAAMCWHELDEMGCGFVMPGNYNFNHTFETCEADVAYPPGWYPTATVDGTTKFSTFAQYFTGTNSDGSGYTVGDTVTPSAPYMTPSSSNCATTSSVGNGVALAQLGISGSAASGPTASGPKQTGSSAGSSSHASNSAADLTSQTYPVIIFISILSGMAAVAIFH